MDKNAKVIFRNGAYKTAPARYQPTPHKRGCPRGGRLKFSQSQVDSLPDVATARQVAKALKIDDKAVRQWMTESTPVLPHRKEKRSYVNGIIRIYREDLESWLRAAGRLK